MKIVVRFDVKELMFYHIIQSSGLNKYVSLPVCYASLFTYKRNKVLHFS